MKHSGKASPPLFLHIDFTTHRISYPSPGYHQKHTYRLRTTIKVPYHKAKLLPFIHQSCLNSFLDVVRRHQQSLPENQIEAPAA